MVKRIAVTVDGIAAPIGRGVARGATVAEAAEEPAPPIVTVTAVVPSPVTADPPHPANVAARRIPVSTTAGQTIDFHHRVIFIVRPLSWSGFMVRYYRFQQS